MPNINPSVQDIQAEIIPITEISFFPQNNLIQDNQIEPIPIPSIAYIPPTPPAPIQNIQVNPISSTSISYINPTPQIIQDNQAKTIPTTSISYISPPHPITQEIQVNPISLQAVAYTNPPPNPIQNIQVNPINPIPMGSILNNPPPIPSVEKKQIQPIPTISQSYFSPLDPTQNNRGIIEDTPLSISYIVPSHTNFGIDEPIPLSSLPKAQSPFAQEIRQPMANISNPYIPQASVQYNEQPIQESPLAYNPQAFPPQGFHQPIPATAMPNNSPFLITQEIDQPKNEASKNNINNPTPFSIFTYEIKDNRTYNNLIQPPSLNQNRNNNFLYNSFETPLNEINYNRNISKEQELSELRKKVNDEQTIIMSLKKENQQKDFEIMQLRNQLLNNSFLRQNQILSQSTPIQASYLALNNNYPSNLGLNIYNTFTPNINGFNNIPPSMDVCSNIQNLNYSTNILQNSPILENSILVGNVQSNNMTPIIPIFQNNIPLNANLTTLSVL
jgi:hypothetical protein